MKRMLACTIALITLPVHGAWAWSAEGHQAVAIIAQKILTDSGQFDQVRELLGPDLSLADIATCPDEVRAFERYHTAMTVACQAVFPDPPTGTAGWHFINLPVSLQSPPTDDDINAACGNACVLTEIVSFGQVLGDPSQDMKTRRQALSWLVHFIGDIHQPLHAAVRGKDAGGNAEHVKIGHLDTNLHHAWDEPLVSAVDPDPTILAAALAPEIATAQSSPVSEPKAWAIESFGFAQSTAYPGIPPADGSHIVADLSPEYTAAGTKLVRMRIAFAGVRLAQFVSDNIATTAH